ncbi:MAG: hypothetical protein ACTTJC_00380 [Campylobacter sp.]
MDIFSGYFIIIAIVAVMLYMQIQKFTNNIDENAVTDRQNDQKALNFDKNQKYKLFCQAIDGELRELKNVILYDSELKNENFKDKFLENLSDMSKKLTFIETMNSNKDAQKWENELFTLLDRLNTLIQDNLKNGDKIADELRERLQNTFQKLG